VTVGEGQQRSEAVTGDHHGHDDTITVIDDTGCH
jgi:hypothetical protein